MGFFSVFSRVVAGIATGGGTEIARLAGGESAAQTVEMIVAPTTPQGIAAVGTLAITGSPTAAGAIGSGVGLATQPSGVPFVVRPTQSVIPTISSVPSPGGGGPAAFSRFTLPAGPRGGNPAWRFSGSSVQQLGAPSGFLEVQGARWAVSRTSVRRL